MKTAGKALTELRKEGLITKKDGRWRRTEKALDEAAKERGTLGYGEAQKDEHEHESDRYSELLAGPPGGGKRRLVTQVRHGDSRANNQGPDDSPDVVWEPELQQAACWKPRRRGDAGG